MRKLIERLKELENFKYSTISGLNDGEKYFLPSLFSSKIVIITTNNQINNYYEQLSKTKKVLMLDSSLPQVISLGEKNTKVFKDYCLTLTNLALNNFDILLLTPSSLFQTLPSKIFAKNFLNLKIGINFNQKELILKLISMGYKKEEILSSTGEFSVRGDIIDLFPINLDRPIRLNFFDDEIEKINYFDPVNFAIEEELNEVQIFMNSLLNFENEDIENLQKTIKQNFSNIKIDAQSLVRLSSIVDSQFEFLQNGSSEVSSVFFLPFLSYFNASIFDYLDRTTKIFIDEPKLITDKLTDIENENLSTFLDLSLKGELLPKAVDFYRKKKDILTDLTKFPLVAFNRLISQNKIFKSDYCLNFLCQPFLNYQNRLLDLIDLLKMYKDNKVTALISAALPLTLKRIKNFLEEEHLPFIELESCSNILNLEEGKIYLTLQNFPYSANFENEKFVLIGSLSLNKESTIKPNKINKPQIEKAKFLPKVNDFVVHEVHGVGKCLGIKNMKLTSVSRDYIIIEYKDGDLLYLPPENADMLSAYVGEVAPKCNKIGGTEFFKIKQKVKNSLKEMAFDLTKVYSERLNSKGFKYSPDTYLQQEFENAFEFSYTPDQISAIKDIKADMESSKIMDRLLCGDVGFGKTEVALVASYKAIQDGKQVAIICPTTILCEQHYNTALSRLKNFLVNVEAINRFKTKREQNKILENLKEGKIDLICGTHRLFSKDVVFKDLGLIILDEEQRFGVEDKEKLKNIKRTVDVLSLSATPIPRTLYMSLTGIRDVSFLSTPPKMRKPIKTMVIDYSDTLLVNACKKELERGGQVLIVQNRIENIYNFYAHVKSLLPDAQIGVAHGQMDAKTLENAIYDLYTRKTQILISTILIENGIDLPFANTLFVMDADKLGLSALYQLKGRIGRSNIEAYAYFSFSKNKFLTQEAYKRLDAIMEFNDFGSGYKIAMRDLEIRGAGDILGKLQHGHIQQVGYDMYVKLLNEAVKEIKGEKLDSLKDIKIDISINAFLPDSYIASNEERISFYTKISKISSTEDFNNLIEETSKSYGDLPKSVLQLCMVGLIKNLAQKINVKQIVLNEFISKVIFYNDLLTDPQYASIYKELSKPSANYVLTCDNMPIIKFRQQNIEKNQSMLINFLNNFTQIKK